VDLADYDRLPSRRFATDEGEVFSIDAGYGPAVVLVHGSPVSSLEYRAAIARLLPEFRVIAPDLLSFGRSSGPARGAGFTEQATALRGFLDSLDLDRFHLVVHDWGGPIGLAAAARRPAQLDRLVLMNTSVRPEHRPPLYWRPFTAPLLGEATLLGANLFSNGLPLFLRAARRDRGLWARYRRPLKDLSTRRTVLRLERLDGYAAECGRIQSMLSEAEVPAMILWGEPDLYFRRELPRMRTQFPTAKVVRLPGAGHFAAEDAADRVAEEIRAFLE
jgi:haloalkane dehalogenase